MTLRIGHEMVAIEPILSVTLMTTRHIVGSSPMPARLFKATKFDDSGFFRVECDANAFDHQIYSPEEFDAFIAALQKLRDQVANGK